jgi:ABC-type branched-subunit amino acid transport system substrate-binding protein
VAQKGNELGVPVIGLSQKSHLTAIGENVFRNALTSQAIVSELVQTAMEKYGMTKFAILYPNDPYGIEYANLFWDEVLARGGQITAAQTYLPEEKDFNGPISRLVGTFYLEDRVDEYSSRLKEWYGQQKVITSRVTPPADLLPPIVDFDALFIPDGIKALGQIASMLRFHDVDKVRLLGTNLWNNPSLVERGTSLIENSLFVDAKTVVDNSIQKTKFYQDYKRLYNEEPSVFEAQAYDTAVVLKHLIEQGARSRGSLRESLTKVRQFQGIVGDINVNEDREFTRALSVLTVKSGKIKSADPSEIQKTE